MKYITVFLCMMICFAANARIYTVKESKINFQSEAPQELIGASSDRLSGVLDADKQTFAFRMPVNSFNGFNSPLQREHFNENYMQSRAFPEATFAGKLLSPVDLQKDGSYETRAKGKLMIHGIGMERIIPLKVTVKDGHAVINGSFAVQLSDHDIKIPRVVYEKLAPEINVTVYVRMAPGA